MVGTRSAENRLLFDILPRVSRSFYLSVRILPAALRRPIGLAYLFCRAADTIADTRLVPRAGRLERLLEYRAAFAEQNLAICQTLATELAPRQDNPAERTLLSSLGQCFSCLDTLGPQDQAHIRTLVLTLTQGMQMDLTLFPAEEAGRVGVLETRADLDRYTYFVAGCVGEFWTKISLDHVASLQYWHAEDMLARAVRFGKGLQLTNILRDLAQDLRIGRCYLPRTDLIALGVEPEQLCGADRLEAMQKVRPLLNELLEVTLRHYQEGWVYTQAIPRREWQLRLACVWPLLIGAATVRLLRDAPDLLDPAIRVKIPRAHLYRLLLGSVVTVWSNRALTRQYHAARFSSQGPDCPLPMKKRTR